MTATEAALYDQQVNGGLRAKMLSLTHDKTFRWLFRKRPTSDIRFERQYNAEGQ